MIATLLTFSGPKSNPQIVNTFSWQGALRCAPARSAPRTSRSFNAARRKPMRTLSLETILVYVGVVGFSVLCHPATYRALLVKSIFTSKIM